MLSAATRNFLTSLAIQSMVGALVGLVFHLTLDKEVALDAAFYVDALLHGALVGLCIGATGEAFEAYLVPRFARLPLILEVVCWSAIMTASIIASLVLGFWVIYGAEMIQRSAHHMPMVVSITLCVAATFAIVTRITRLIGSGFFVGILFGSYLRPRLETRIVLFLDMEGSTAAAERLGEAKMQSMIAQFFSDIDGAFTEADGEVVSYVGDGVIVVWPALSPARNGRAVSSLVDAQRLIDNVAVRYRERFGADPQFRAGLHLGTVSVGEIGGRRRQISLFGDAMNVAARLQEVAKTGPGRWVASQAYLEAATLPAGLTATPLGALSLRGREQKVEAYALATR